MEQWLWPIRSEYLFVARASDPNWLYKDRGIRHMCGEVVVQVATGKATYTGKALFDKVRPLDNNIYNITAPIANILPYSKAIVSPDTAAAPWSSETSGTHTPVAKTQFLSFLL